VKEVAVLRKGPFSHIAFLQIQSWKLLTRSENSCASWLIVYHHELQWEDGMIPYTIAKRMITMAVIGIEKDDDNNEAFALR